MPKTPELKEQVMDKGKIKCCPFCGKEPELITRGNSASKSRSAEIYCKPCYTIMKVGAIRNSIEWCEAKVIEKWNTRTTPST